MLYQTSSSLSGVALTRQYAGYGCYKIPTVLLTTNGTLLAMIEARKYSCDDQGWVDLRLKRSFDSGATWGASQLVHHHSTADEWTTVGDANMVFPSRALC